MGMPSGLRVAFPLVLRGYDRAAVDELVERGGRALVSESPGERAAVRDAVEAARFRIVLRGYDRGQVDAWLDDLVARLG